MLTKRQKQILNYIEKFIEKNDYSPTLKEIKRHFKLSSVSTVHEHIQALRNKGYLNKIDGKPRSLNPIEKRGLETVTMFLRGVVSAGQPIEAIDDPELITVPKSMVGGVGNYFALKVEGNSMAGKGIANGDLVIIKKQPVAQNGETALAIINDDEATIKTYEKKGKKILLKPANKKYKTREYKQENVKIQGKVVGIIKKF